MALEDKIRVAAPDGLVAQVDGVTGRRYTATGGGMYEMLPRDAKALLREGGFVPSIGGVTRGGYQCPGCGFMAVVRRCSRCGEHCETAAERSARLVAEAAGGNLPEIEYPPVGDAVRETVVRVHRGGLVMEMEINTATGDVREISPARREAPIATRPHEWIRPAREILFGPTAAGAPAAALQTRGA